MEVDYQDVSGVVFRKSLENFAFMFAEPASKGVLSLLLSSFFSDLFLAEMYFFGEVNGELKIAIPTYLGVEMAVNGLGVEINKSNERGYAQEATGEFLKIVCEEMMEIISGKKITFDSSGPYMKLIDKDKGNDFLTDEKTISFIVEEYPVLFQFEVYQKEQVC